MFAKTVRCGNTHSALQRTASVFRDYLYFLSYSVPIGRFSAPISLSLCLCLVGRCRSYGTGIASKKVKSRPVNVTTSQSFGASLVLILCYLLEFAVVVLQITFSIRPIQHHPSWCGPSTFCFSF